MCLCDGPGRESERSNITGIAYAQPSLDSFLAPKGDFRQKRYACTRKRQLSAPSGTRRGL